MNINHRVRCAEIVKDTNEKHDTSKRLGTERSTLEARANSLKCDMFVRLLCKNL
jgi:hypothetical protein